MAAEDKGKMNEEKVMGKSGNSGRRIFGGACGEQSCYKQRNG